MDNYLTALMKLLQVNEAPLCEGSWLQIDCQVGFEPNGRASETWETYWSIILWKIPYHWRGADGVWYPGHVRDPKADHMSFQAETYGAVVQRAYEFLREFRIQEAINERKTTVLSTHETI